MMRKTYNEYINVKESGRNGNKRKNTGIALFFSLLCVFCFFSCSDGRSDEIVQNEEISIPLDEEKCVNFAEQLHYSFADSNISYMNSYIDWELIENNVTDGISLRMEIYDTLISKYNIAEEFIDFTYTEADVRFITYYVEEDKHYILFRVFEQPQNLNVYEFELQGNSSEISITNIYDYSTAESMITTLRKEIDFWSQWGGEWYIHYKELQGVLDQFKTLIFEENLKDAYLLTKKYSNDFFELARFRQLYGLICQSSNSVEMMVGYLDEEVSRIPLSEKGRWLPLFYLRSLEMNFGEALIALSNLESEIGKDVYIDFLRGNVYFEMGDYEAAINWFNKALSEDSQVLVFYLAKAYCFIEMGKYIEAVETLLVMDDSFDIQEINWQLEFSEYPSFTLSDEFNEFLSRLD